MYEARCRSHFDYYGEDEDIKAFSISLGGLKKINAEGQAELVTDGKVL